MADPYATAPLELDKQSFRLINLCLGEASGIIQCTLRSHLERSHPSYTAVSYARGPDEIYNDIEVNDVRFPVRKNLWDFLSQMRSTRYDDPLWIDAICIQQDKV